tara:strand:- start:644 stop:757 length:114 start_codon:yes stop_codon:yes gene_type:complete
VKKLVFNYSLLTAPERRRKKAVIELNVLCEFRQGEFS